MIDDKPPLQGVYIAHFGVRGMKWGQRRKSSGSSGKKSEPKMTTGKKVAVGAAVLGGAAVAAIILSRRGRVPAVRVSKVSLKPSVMDKLREAQQMKIDNFNQMKPRLGKMHFLEGNGASWSPEKSSALVRRSGVQAPKVNVYADRLRRSGIDSSGRKMDYGNIADIRRAMNDPNHVWQL